MSSSQELDILGHIQDGATLEFFNWEVHLPTLHIGSFELPITRHVVMMWVVSALLLLIMTTAARRKGMVPKGIRNLVEAMLVFIRDGIVHPQLHSKEKTLRFLPFLATVFFFILFCNLLGLVPFGATATGNIFVTASLAVISFLMIHVSGIIEHGPFHYFKNLVPPVPWWLYPLMLVVELVAHMARPFALAVRLFANMLGGHIVLLVIMGFIFTFKNLAIASVSVVAAVALSLLELLVAFIQAYVFTFLTTVFIGGAVSEGH